MIRPVIQVNLWRWPSQLGPALEHTKAVTGAEIRVVIVGRLTHRSVYLHQVEHLNGEGLKQLREYGWMLIDTAAKWFGEPMVYGRTVFQSKEARKMERIPDHVQLVDVESSNVAKIGHDAQDSTLFVQYKHGGIYWYNPFSDTQYQELANAPSIGGWINAHIKGNPNIAYGKIGDVSAELTKQAKPKAAAAKKLKARR